MRLPKRLMLGLRLGSGGTVCGILWGASLISASSAVAQDAAMPMPVDIVLNGRETQRAGLIVVSGERIFVRIADLRDLGLVTEFGEDLAWDGDAFSDIAQQPGLSARLAPDGTTLMLQADARHLPRTYLPLHESPIAVARAVPVAFIDYDLNFSDQRGYSRASAVMEAGVSGEWGVISTGAIADTGQKRPVRLDTTYVRDFPERSLRLSVGDTFTRAAPWSQPARFAGVRFGTDFSLDPALITFPVPSLSGSSLLPSTIELASQANRQSISVEPGRFALDYRPRFTGAGNVTMTVRDLAGNERTVTRSFYASTAILRPGLAEFSLELGVLRKNYGLRSFSYGAPFVAGSYRRGVSDVLTLEARSEADSHVRMAGAGATWVVQPFGEIRLDAAASQGDAGAGGLYQFQFQRLAPDYSFTASYRRRGSRFRQVGELRRDRGPSREMAIAGSIVLGRWGGLNAGYLRSEDGAGRSSIASLGYSASLGRAFLSIGMQRIDREEGAENTAFGTITLPLGGRRHIGLFGDDRRVFATFEKVAPSSVGMGYRLAAGHEAEQGQWLEGAATLRTSAGQLDVAATRRGNGIMTRLEARGALVATGGGIVATPGISQGMAVVEVAGDRRVPVLLENQPAAARAGAGRTAILTGLQPYVANRISIDPAALPITGELGGVEQVVAPGWKQAARVTFGSRAVHPARLRLLDEAGKVVPPGLSVDIGAEPGATVTGHDGEVFLSDYPAEAHLRIGRGSPAECEATLPAKPAVDTLAEPMILTCRPIAKEPLK